MNKLKIGVLIYTHDRVEDAKVNMDIIRNYWTRSKVIESVKIIHCFNGQKSWYQKKYKEDELIRLKNSGHFQGASELIDAGMDIFASKYPDLDYVIILASDTWLIKTAYLDNLLKQMKKENRLLATCPWGLPKKNNIRDVGMAVDFFIVDFKWTRKYQMFPIEYKKFMDKYWDFMMYVSGSNISYEKLVFAEYLKAIFRQLRINNSFRHLGIKKILMLHDREPVHSHINKDGFWIRKMYWPKMGLLTHHEPAPKKRILKQLRITKGESITKLLTSKKLDYYNIFIKNDFIYPKS